MRNTTIDTIEGEKGGEWSNFLSFDKLTRLYVANLIGSYLSANSKIFFIRAECILIKLFYW